MFFVGKNQHARNMLGSHVFFLNQVRGEARALQLESSPGSQQLEKALMRQGRPSTAKEKKDYV